MEKEDGNEEGGKLIMPQGLDTIHDDDMDNDGVGKRSINGEEAQSHQRRKKRGRRNIPK